MATTPTRTRLARSERMEQTLSVAHGLFAERGFAAVTMDEVAGEVGVTKPLLYNYFGNKERLYIACMERSGDALFATIAEAVAGDRQPRRRAQRRPSRLLRLPRRRPRRLGGPLRRDPAAAAARSPTGSPYTAAASSIGRGLAAGAAAAAKRSAARVEVEALSTALLGAAEALARWWLRTEAFSAQEAAELLISTIEPGLRTRSTPSRNPSPTATER